MRARAIIASLFAVMIVMLASYITSAALTPAGAQIKNSAIAYYTDANRNPKAEATSNEVVTLVSTLRGVDITPNPDPVTGVSYAVGTTDDKDVDQADFGLSNANAITVNMPLFAAGDSVSITFQVLVDKSNPQA